MTDTIFALATGLGRAAVAILRMSGPGTDAALRGLAGALPPPRVAALRTLRDPASGEMLDRALVLRFVAPASYTGEDAAELHLHGGSAVIRAVAEALTTLGIRPAGPGEFSRRAFLNGRLDLPEAEAVVDLIAAETSAQRRQALMQLGGALRVRAEDWTARLTRLVAHEEALIDFPEEDLPPNVAERAELARAELHREIEAALADVRRGERLRAGLTIAILGPPNAGKSSLLNALAGEDVAIVSETPGTTRDVLEVRLDLDGVAVALLDTAGLRNTADGIEGEGIRRALARAAAADLLLIVEAPDARGVALEPVADVPVLAVWNKADLGVDGPSGAISISARSGKGMGELVQRLREEVTRLVDAASPALLSRPRHRAVLAEALTALDRAAQAGLPELRAEDLRLALRALGRLTGRVVVDDVLDVIFREFCIGK